LTAAVSEAIFSAQATVGLTETPRLKPAHLRRSERPTERTNPRWSRTTLRGFCQPHDSAIRPGQTDEQQDVEDDDPEDYRHPHDGDGGQHANPQGPLDR
jgi:hypothetical protein